MKLRKIIPMIIVFALLLAFTSCAFMQQTGEGETDISQTPNQTEIEENNIETDPEPETESEPENTAGQTEVTVEPHVIFEENGIRISVKSLDMNAFWGPELKLLVENDSEENVDVTANNIVVNGYMFSAYLYTDVSAGKKVNCSVSLSKSDLEFRGIDTVAEIEMDFSVYKNDSWDLICQSDLISIKTSAADSYVYNYDESGTKVYDDNGVLVVVKGFINDEFYGDCISVYAYNTGDIAVTVSARDVSVNGFMIDPWFSCSILPGKHAISKMSFSEDDLKENDIEKIEDVEITFYIYETDSWLDIAYADPVHLTNN